jgi:hypothetical protein
LAVNYKITSINQVQIRPNPIRLKKLDSYMTPFIFGSCQIGLGLDSIELICKDRSIIDTPKYILSVKAKNKKDAFCNRINVYFCNGLSVYFEVQNESINFRKLSLVANKLKTT